MRVLVTGATGFIGRHVVAYLRQLGGHHIIAGGRREDALRQLGCEYVVHDLSRPEPDLWKRLGEPEVLIHLAWDRLQDYRNLSHIEQSISVHGAFFTRMLIGGVKTISCAGTCFEYGMQSGPLSEELPPQPVLPYAVAKDSLRRYLEFLVGQVGTARSRWLRVFFTHGEGQRATSLLAQLDRTIDSGGDHFEMSPGDQLRDYLPVERVAEYIVKSTLQLELDGIINICSGEPVSVRSVVERRLSERAAFLSIRRGCFGYAEHEPLAFWGNDARLRQALEAYDSLAKDQPAADDAAAYACVVEFAGLDLPAGAAASQWSKAG